MNVVDHEKLGGPTTVVRGVNIPQAAPEFTDEELAAQERYQRAALTPQKVSVHGKGYVSPAKRKAKKKARRVNR